MSSAAEHSADLVIRTNFHDDGLRMRVIVAAPKVSITGKGAMRALEISMWGYL